MKEKSYVEDIDRSVYDFKDDEKDAVDKALEEMSAPFCANINDGSYAKTCPLNQNLTAIDERNK